MKQLFRKKNVEQILADVQQGFGEGEHGTGLSKELKLFDLTSLGIAAIIGAGIFATIGKASYNGGPAVSLLFIFVAVACIFSAFCYAQFASLIPVSGSAYTYSYATFGELIAWIIGWALILEYSVGNIVVAISWSGYFTGFLQGFGIDFPAYLSTNYAGAQEAFEQVSKDLAQGVPLDKISSSLREGYLAWQNAPEIAGVKIILDLPAFLSVVLVSVLAYIGIKESKTASNIMVAVKVMVVILVILVGMFYVNPKNWSPFAPNGIEGVLQGIAAIFFSYIGFDAISTTAEECKNPQRDLPRAMILSVVISTILYVGLTLVLTGVMNYTQLNSEDPLADMFHFLKMDFLSGIVAVSAVFAMTSVLLVFQLGQPRIWMTMSRDGLIPPIFAKIHPRFHTPSFATIVAGLLVALPTPFINIDFVVDLTSIGTLFAFVLVCGGVLILQNSSKGREQITQARFQVPYFNAKFIVPILFVAGFALAWVWNKDSMTDFFTFSNAFRIETLQKELATKQAELTQHATNEMKMAITTLRETLKAEQEKTALKLFFERLPLWIFFAMCIAMSWLSWKKNLSLIPVLGLLVNFYLMSEIGIANWIGFVVWLAIGLLFYFNYGYKKSRLAQN
ncbi:MAG: amino acid permease [Raineya sp.]|nr:amino acid permease [Raineya sp.]